MVEERPTSAREGPYENLKETTSTAKPKSHKSIAPLKQCGK